ncbi:ATP-binding protein [Pelagibius sp. Alg239-R121]|uniref:sensor histidine kinase n=1 Tax=Pelagibius sp. Alg239-R121 TaxID=2993448 RepID=UPI0024A6B947|nr:ATP-binding protein [Pelagibius sp. Alg239-R121]
MTIPKQQIGKRAQTLNTFQRRNVLLAILVVGFCLVIWQTAQLSYDFFLHQTQAQSRQSLNLYAQNLRRSLERYEFLPSLYANHASVAGLLAHPESPEFLAQSNALLERSNRLTGSSNSYLLDTKGITLAASNWDQTSNFIGRNFSSEPYFKAAMQGRLGRYYAIGSGSDERGYYFASPVRRDGIIRGVVVAIVGVEAIEDSWWTTGRNELFVTDDNGIIFISSRPGWRYRRVPATKSSDAGQQINEAAAVAVQSARYNQAAITPFNLVYGRNLKTGGRVVQIAPFDDTEADFDAPEPDSGAQMVQVGPTTDSLPNYRGSRTENYLLQNLQMRELGWTLYFLADISTIPRQTATVTILVGVVLIALALGSGFWIQRRRNLTQRAELQQQSRVALEAAYGELETRVHDRTRDLVESNRMLQDQIQERRRAEQELRQTQDELVQAEKLAALGHISAGISHELNQPLTAIRSFSDNARKLLDRERFEDVHSNLGLISELTGRMAQLMKQLRTFARNAPAQKSVISLQSVLDRTIEVLQSRIDEMSVKLEIGNNTDVQVFADELRLEQVLGNILGNALDAVTSCENPLITIQVEAVGQDVTLIVRDSGPGIPAHHINEIFDPFFTTKDVGQGLGLGLSITYGIVKDFGGSIRASNHVDGGAVFTLSLPRFDEQLQQERKAV